MASLRTQLGWSESALRRQIECITSQEKDKCQPHEGRGGVQEERPTCQNKTESRNLLFPFQPTAPPYLTPELLPVALPSIPKLQQVTSVLQYR